MSKDLAFAKRAIIFTVCVALAGCARQADQTYCAIRVIDVETGRGIPAVRLQSLNKASYITDSQGYIAFFEPGLMDRQVYFEIDAEGYRIDLDRTGRHATALFIESQGEVTVPMRRGQAAERLYRLTGHGIYRESFLLGKEVPIQFPNINAGVLGQDSNLGVIYDEKVFWVWGDTFLPGAYDGNFSVSAATSLLPQNGGLDPDIGIDYTYFVDDQGYSKPMIDLEGPGYTWFEWLFPLQDSEGLTRLIAKYARIGGLWQNYERGIAVYNDSLEVFEKHTDVPEWLTGFAVMQHPFLVRYGDMIHMYSSAEFDLKRVSPQLDSVASPRSYRTFTCLKEGASFNLEEPALDRDEYGKLKYGWKASTDAVDAGRQSQLILSGHIQPEEAWIQLRDMVTNKQHRVRRGSINWNEYRQKWILIAQGDGDDLGNVVYSEADSPIGPWAYASVVAHHNNLFYNPVHHSFFDDDRHIYFEGTYTNFWNQGQTKQYYDYNQLQYRLDLKHDMAMVPSPVYEMANGDLAFASSVRSDNDWDSVVDIAFYAFEPEHKPNESLPFFKVFDGEVSLSEKGQGAPFMYALSPEVNRESMVVGTWDIHLKSFVSIDAYLQLTIDRNGETWNISTPSETMEVRDIVVAEDILSFSVFQYGKQYRLSGMIPDIEGGKVTGTWRMLRDDGTTSDDYQWTGARVDDQWYPGQNRSLLSINSKGAASAADAICRVWPNPHDQLFLEPHILPAK